MANSNYRPTPNPLQPTVAGAPFTLANLNPYGSNYATNYTYDETKLIADAIEYAIFDATPEKYKALKLILSNTMIEKGADEFSYFEKTFGRTAVTAFDSPGAANPQTITLAGTFTNVQDVPVVVGDVLTHPNGNVPVIVTVVTWSNVANSTTITVASQTGAGNVPATTAAQVFAIQSTIIADGMNYFLHYDRPNVVERYNYVQLFQRVSRWNRMELQKMINMGTTDYMSFDKNEKLEQLRVDLFVSAFNGTRGEFAITPGGGGSYYAKCMGGLYPLMVGAGSAHSSTPIAGLKAAFETLAFQTNYQKEGGVRVIYATEEMLYEISKLWKEDAIQYTPNDKIGDLNLNEYKLGTMRFVPTPCELFRENSAFPAAWANKIIVVDQASVNPVKVKGIPHIEMGVTDNKQRGSSNDFQEWWVAANMSLQFNNPLAGFYIDIV